MLFVAEQHFALQGATQNHDTPRSAPTQELNHPLLALPALPCIAPLPAGEAALDIALHILRQAQLEQVVHLTRFQRRHRRLAALAAQAPEAGTPDGTTPRLALGDIAENLEGTNCDSRLVARIDEALGSLPAE